VTRASLRHVAEFLLALGPRLLRKLGRVLDNLRLPRLAAFVMLAIMTITFVFFVHQYERAAVVAEATRKHELDKQTQENKAKIETLRIAFAHSSPTAGRNWSMHVSSDLSHVQFEETLKSLPPDTPECVPSAGAALLAAGLEVSTTYSLSEAKKVYAAAAAIVRKDRSSDFLGFPSSPLDAAILADLEGDGTLDQFELECGLPSLVGKAHWSAKIPLLLWEKP